MRHYKKGRKLGTDKSHTKAMKRSLVTSLLTNDRIKTTEARAKEIRPDVDKIITWAKRGDLHSRRLAIAALGGNNELVREVFEKVAQGMFKDRQGGYTRIMKLGYRKGDNAPMVIMELVTEPVQKKADKDEAEKSTAKKSRKKAAPKKVKKSEETAGEEAGAKEASEEAAEAKASEAEGAVEEVAEEAADTEVKKAEEAAEEAAEEIAEEPAEETVEKSEAAEASEEEKTE